VSRQYQCLFLRRVLLQLVVTVTVTIDSMWLKLIDELSKTELSAFVEHIQVMRGDYRRIHDIFFLFLHFNQSILCQKYVAHFQPCGITR